MKGEVMSFFFFYHDDLLTSSRDWHEQVHSEHFFSVGESTKKRKPQVYFKDPPNQCFIGIWHWALKDEEEVMSGEEWGHIKD